MRGGGSDERATMVAEDLLLQLLEPTLLVRWRSVSLG